MRRLHEKGFMTAVPARRTKTVALTEEGMRASARSCLELFGVG